MDALLGKLRTLLNCFCIFWCMFEVFCFGALHYGWASLAYILKKEGFFYSGCETQNDTIDTSRQALTCPSQDGKLSLLYSVSTGIMIVPLVICGTLIGRIGVVKTRIIYICLFVTGCATILASNSENPWLMAVGLAWIGSGGRVFFLSSVQKITVLKSGSFILIAALNGCYDSSAAVMLFVKVAFDAGVNRWLSFAFLLGFSMTSFVSTWVVFRSKKQDDPVSTPVISDKESDIREVQKTDHGTWTISYIYRIYACSSTFKSHALWNTIISFHLMFCIASGHIYIQHIVQKTENTDESSLTNFLSASLLTGFIPALCAGFYLELFQHKLTGSPYIRNLKTLIIGVATVNVLSVAIAILSMFYVLPVVYTNFIVFPVLRGLFFSVVFSFISKLFAAGSFGVLASILDLLTYAALFTQRASIVWVQSYDNAILHIRLVFAALSIIAMFHPVLMWIQMRKLSKNKKQLSDRIDDAGHDIDGGNDIIQDASHIIANLSKKAYPHSTCVQ